MSKKRLEEIIEKVKRSDEYAEKELWEASDGIIVHLHNEGYINYLIERVQELEDIIYQDERQAVLEGMYEQNKRYREALVEIINARNHFYPTEYVFGVEGIAREALDERSNR